MSQWKSGRTDRGGEGSWERERGTDRRGGKRERGTDRRGGERERGTDRQRTGSDGQLDGQNRALYYTDLLQHREAFSPSHGAEASGASLETQQERDNRFRTEQDDLNNMYRVSMNELRLERQQLEESFISEHAQLEIEHQNFSNVPEYHAYIEQYKERTTQELQDSQQARRYILDKREQDLYANHAHYSQELEERQRLEMALQPARQQDNVERSMRQQREQYSSEWSVPGYGGQDLGGEFAFLDSE